MLFQGGEGPPEVDFWKSEKIWIKPVIHSPTLMPFPILLFTYLYSPPSYHTPSLFVTFIHYVCLKHWLPNKMCADGILNKRRFSKCFFWFHSEVEDSRTCEHIFFRQDHQRYMWLPSVYVSEILRIQIEPDIIAKIYSDITQHSFCLFNGNCWAGLGR